MFFQKALSYMFPALSFLGSNYVITPEVSNSKKANSKDTERQSSFCIVMNS